MSEDEKLICESIKKHMPIWKKETDEFIINFCGAVPIVEELIGNKGYTIDNAVKYAFNII